MRDHTNAMYMQSPSTGIKMKSSNQGSKATTVRQSRTFLAAIKWSRVLWLHFDPIKIRIVRTCNVHCFHAHLYISSICPCWSRSKVFVCDQWPPHECARILIGSRRAKSILDLLIIADNTAWLLGCRFWTTFDCLMSFWSQSQTNQQLYTGDYPLHV